MDGNVSRGAAALRGHLGEEQAGACLQSQRGRAAGKLGQRETCFFFFLNRFFLETERKVNRKEAAQAVFRGCCLSAGGRRSGAGPARATPCPRATPVNVASRMFTVITTGTSLFPLFETNVALLH